MRDSLSRERIEFLKKDFSQGFTAYCGLEAISITPGRVESRILIGPEHRQQDGFIHAGVTTTLADHTAGYAAFTLAGEMNRILTVEFKINFLRPAFGDELICRARVIKPGAKLMICESDVFDQREDGEILAARLMATMAVVPSEKLENGKQYSG